MADAFIDYSRQRLSDQDMISRAQMFYEEMNSRRSVRAFSDESIPHGVIENIIRTAATAPSGANKQPWTFCVVYNPALKKKIREAAEQEEKQNYSKRMSEEWLQDLAPLGTDENKQFLETAPALIVVFRRPYEEGSDQQKRPNYYVSESVGIACGMLITAIHHAGLCCLTHTPSPMNFLERILDRPSNERAYLLIPVGFPASGVKVPDIRRKPLEICMKNYK
jgi:nitroreductase